VGLAFLPSSVVSHLSESSGANNLLLFYICLEYKLVSYSFILVSANQLCCVVDLTAAGSLVPLDSSSSARGWMDAHALACVLCSLTSC
jgi:hypothetical protein